MNTSLSSREDVFTNKNFTYKPTDDIGRQRIYCKKAISSLSFLEICNQLETLVKGGHGSRWSMRGVIKEEVSTDDIERGLPSNGINEINIIPINYYGTKCSYAWVSRNNDSRTPDPEERTKFINKVAQRIEYQRAYQENHRKDTEELINKAENLGLQLVCNDPFGEWGEKKIDFNELYKFIGSYFYASKEEVKSLVNGIGYSTYHHYIFGIRSNSGELLAVYFLAKWPWGFEGTYTMVKPNRNRLGLARILMLFAHALITTRYGDEHLIYGESNAANCKPCIQSGFEIIPPSVKGNNHRNLVWADNPIGAYTEHLDQEVAPPTYHKKQYSSYVLIKLNRDLVKPFTRAAFQFLKT